MTAINIINRFRFAIASLVAPFPITRIVDFPVRFSESGIWESEMYGDEDADEGLEDDDWFNTEIPCCQACHDGGFAELGNCPHCKTGIYAESVA